MLSVNLNDIILLKTTYKTVQKQVCQPLKNDGKRIQMKCHVHKSDTYSIRQ